MLDTQNQIDSSEAIVEKSFIESEQGRIGDEINQLLVSSEEQKSVNLGDGINIGGINYLSESLYGNIKVLRNSEGLFFFFDISKSEFLFGGKGFEKFEGFIGEHGKFGSFNDDEYLYLMNFGNISYKKISIYNLQHNIECGFLEKLDHGDVYDQMRDYLRCLPNGRRFYFDSIFNDNNGDLIIPFNYNGIYMLYNFSKGNLLNGNIFLSNYLTLESDLDGIKFLGRYCIIPGLTNFILAPKGFSGDFNHTLNILEGKFLIIDGELFMIDHKKKNVGIFDFETGEIIYGTKFSFDESIFSYLPENFLNDLLALFGVGNSQIKNIKYTKK